MIAGGWHECHPLLCFRPAMLPGQTICDINIGGIRSFFTEEI
ncbi:hypothetical protein GFC29_3812 (plasmid) [Anoxybacillus sp. B7M1]|nr:hypothetical protein GFC29_3812 [Anoxybacillus sp. B7M1]